MIGDSDFGLSDRMDELSHLGRNFHENLKELRSAQTFSRTGGPEFDPRIRTLVLLLAPIYRRYLNGQVTMNKSADGSYNGPFIKFCRAACEHFLPPGLVKNPTLDQAAVWVVTSP
ncbi:hypothetical protein FQV39_20160 [Bosea sp. F3-2]|uniref:hypothetical protein n=1 Tax=Bosea sp. F3-2 TaxID=2599640 RepID=UPI0011ED2591|nr:hypothetical protein [Bosea sp. F3-2]QEL24640.1 hypothetical protein FQV39_20160 [Bosea sp. F3-2]